MTSTAMESDDSEGTDRDDASTELDLVPGGTK